MVKYRWEKESLFVAIEGAYSVDHKQSVLTVETNAFKEELPPGWREQVLESNQEEVNRLVESVSKRADENGYHQIQMQ